MRKWKNHHEILLSLQPLENNRLFFPPSWSWDPSDHNAIIIAKCSEKMLKRNPKRNSDEKLLSVSWITNNYGGPTNVNELSIQPYTPKETLLRWNRLEKLNEILEICLRLLVGWRPPSWKKLEISICSSKSGLQPVWLLSFNRRKPFHPSFFTYPPSLA